MQLNSLFYPDFDPERLYVENPGLEWRQVELTDGRVVTMLIPEDYKEINKCTIKTKCTNWSCVKCYDASFMCIVDKIHMWHNDKSPRMIAKTCNSNFNFLCDQCHHLFDIKLGNVVSNGRWCAYCSHQKLCSNDECSSCYDNSFASHPRVACWSKKNECSARSVFKSSTKCKYWFTCEECHHDFDNTTANVLHDQWCPYCSKPPKRICSEKVCDHCHKLSFASQPKAQYWSEKNKLTPRQVFRAVDTKYWFDCDTCSRPFQTALDKIAMGRWCPNCNCSKFELSVAEFLDAKEIKYVREYSFPGSNLRYDFYIDEKGLLIEADGGQHFWSVPYFHPPSKNETQEQKFARMQQVDRDKDTLARDNDMYLIRIDHTLTTNSEKMGQLLEYILGLCTELSDELADNLEHRNGIYYSNRELYSYLLTSPVESVQDLSVDTTKDGDAIETIH